MQVYRLKTGVFGFGKKYVAKRWIFLILSLLTVDQTELTDVQVPMLESLVKQFLYYPTVLAPDATLPYYAQGAQEILIDSADGNRIHALYWEAPAGRPTILFFHGNAQSVFEWALIKQEFENLECGLLLIDYPGYGKCSGAPSEAGLYAAGEVAATWLLSDQKIPAEKIVLFGKSLGGGVASKVALGNNFLGVVFESTFRSIPSVAKKLLPVLPANALLKSELYETEKRIQSIKMPILIIHGILDELIPVEEAKALYDLANDPKRIELIDNAGHNDVSFVAGERYGSLIRKWLEECLAQQNAPISNKLSENNQDRR